MSLIPYPAVRPTETPYLETAPEAWTDTRLKRVARVAPSNIDKHTVPGQAEVSLCNYVDVYRNDRIDGSISFMKATATEDQIEKFSLKADDCLITKDSESPFDIAVPAVVINDMPGVVCGYHLAMIRPTKVSGRFLGYLFQSAFAKATFVVAAKGITRYALGTYPIENFRFALPSPNEQASIAAFLDHESKKIDDLVADQEKLVVLLKEKRQGLISHIVTKGLDPKAPMRDSGVEWIGQVPKHWEIMPMRRAIDGIEQGWSAECENRSADDVEMAVVKLSAVKNGVFVPAENKVFHPSLEPEMRYEIKAGDFLLTRANTRDLVGECCIVGDEVRRGLMMPDLIYRIRFNSRVIPNYMLAWLRSVGGRYGISIDARGSSMTMAKIAQSHINCWPIPVPSPKEQMAIADAVDGFTTPINALIEQAEKASVLLKERRAALISAAVTGKIDVRSFVTPKKAVAA